MPLSLHQNYVFGSYEADRDRAIKFSENSPLAKDPSRTNIRAEEDLVGHAFIGYGYDLFEKSPTELATHLTAASQQTGTSVTLSQSDISLLTQYRAGQISVATITGTLSLSLPTEAYAAALLDVVVAGTENRISELYPGLRHSKERAALVSMHYNGDDGLVGVTTRLHANLNSANPDRAEAWFEIRYGSNGGASRSAGIAKRRYFEADLFGLYDDPSSKTSGQLLEEHTSVLGMYTRHRSAILSYEASFGGQVARATEDFGLTGSDVVDTLAEALRVARQTLIGEHVVGNDLIKGLPPIVTPETYESFLERNFVNGDVLIGDDSANLSEPASAANPYDLTGTDRNDLILAQGGDDVVEGKAGQDIIYGGAGQDMLRGGKGSDHLFGEADVDALEGGTENDFLFGGAGDDILLGDKGNDELYGDEDKDFLAGDDGNDKLHGGAGVDHLQGGAGADELYGEDGNDVLEAGQAGVEDGAIDHLYGGAGLDTYYVGLGDVVHDDNGEIFYNGVRYNLSSVYERSGEDSFLDSGSGIRLQLADTNGDHINDAVHVLNSFFTIADDDDYSLVAAEHANGLLDAPSGTSIAVGCEHHGSRHFEKGHTTRVLELWSERGRRGQFRFASVARTLFFGCMYSAQVWSGGLPSLPSGPAGSGEYTIQRTGESKVREFEVPEAGLRDQAPRLEWTARQLGEQLGHDVCRNLINRVTSSESVHQLAGDAVVEQTGDGRFNLYVKSGPAEPPKRIVAVEMARSIDLINQEGKLFALVNVTAPPLAGESAYIVLVENGITTRVCRYVDIVSYSLLAGNPVLCEKGINGREIPVHEIRNRPIDVNDDGTEDILVVDGSNDPTEDVLCPGQIVSIASGTSQLHKPLHPNAKANSGRRLCHQYVNVTRVDGKHFIEITTSSYERRLYAVDKSMNLNLVCDWSPKVSRSVK